MYPKQGYNIKKGYNDNKNEPLVHEYQLCRRYLIFNNITIFNIQKDGKSLDNV